MNRLVFRSFCVSTLFVLASACGSNELFSSPVTTQEPNTDSPQSKKATIRVDLNGIPHITAETETGAYYALGWILSKQLQAELISKLAMASLRAAEFFDDGIYPLLLTNSIPRTHAFGGGDWPLDESKGPQPRTLVDVEKTKRLYRMPESIKKILSEMPARDLAAIQAYVDGVNDSVRTHSDGWAKTDARSAVLRDHGLFRFRVTVEDVIANSLDLFIWAHILTNQEHINGYHTAERAGRPLESVETRLKELTASNQFAVAFPSLPHRGTAHMIDPHLPVIDNRYQLFAFQMTAPGINVMGSTLNGFPIMLLGHNEKVSISHTSNHTSVEARFRLPIETRDSGLFYRAFETNGEARPVQVRKYEITDHSGKTHAFQAHDIPDRGFLIYRGANHGVTFRLPKDGAWNVLKQYFALNRAQSVPEAIAALALQEVPLFNTMLADAQNIYYVNNVMAFTRNDELNWLAPVDAMDPRSKLGPIFPFKKIPQIINPKEKYLSNCNNSHDTTHASMALKNYPKHLYYTGHQSFMEYRQQRSTELLRKLSARDEVTIEDLEKTAVDKYSYPYRKMIETLKATLAAYDPATEPSGLALSEKELAAATEELMSWLSWNYEMTRESKIALRAVAYRHLSAPLLSPQPTSFINVYDPSKIRPYEGSDAYWALKTLANLQDELKAWGAENKTWGEVHRICSSALITDCFPTSGGFGLMRAMSEDFIASEFWVTGGQVWVQIVEHGVVTRSRFIKAIHGTLYPDVNSFARRVTENFANEKFESTNFLPEELTPERIHEIYEL